MQHHEVHKCIILVPQLWFMKQWVGRGGNNAGRKVNKVKFFFWNGPFWTLSCCSVWNMLYGLPSCSGPPPSGSMWAEAPGSADRTHADFPVLHAGASAPAACVLRHWCCWEVRSVAVFLSSSFGLSTSGTLSVFPFEKGLLLYREMDLTVRRKQVTSHHYIL